MKRLCPACSVRHAKLIDPGCSVCQGVGTVTLGEAALAFNDPDVVSIAVGVALEAYARTIDKALTLSDDRLGPMRATVKQLVDAGLIDRPARARKQREPLAPAESPRKLAGSVAAVSVTEGDERLQSAPPFAYSIGDRPNARGLPLLSSEGYPSHLARVVDPAEPGRDTSAHLVARKSAERRAYVVVRAAPEAVKIKTRKRRNA